jgi:hypothetical protein
MEQDMTFEIGEVIEDPTSGEYARVVEIEPETKEDRMIKVYLEDSKRNVLRRPADLFGGWEPRKD